jgi:excisionase family DNA binding protein
MRQKYLSVKQAAVYLTLAPSTIYTYIHYGKIPFAKIGERVVFEQNRLDRWIKTKTKGDRRC